MTEQEAKQIMGDNFIGSAELASFASKLRISFPAQIPEIEFTREVLENNSDTHLLILGIEKDNESKSLTINRLRELFGVDPALSEPCMYNQDWYLKEKFASETTLLNKWYLIAKNVLEESRAMDPEVFVQKLGTKAKFPSAILTCFTFFAYYFLRGEILWQNDFVWCEDTDTNGDRIYTGRYTDPKGINKNGFNIHRHLSLRPVYGVALEIK